MEGGFFLVQRVDLEQEDGQRITGLEVVGHERPLGAEPSEDIKSHFYSNTGDTIDYVYELEGTPSRSGPWRGDLQRTTGAPLATTAPPSAAPGTTRGRRLRGELHQGRVTDTLDRGSLVRRHTGIVGSGGAGLGGTGGGHRSPTGSRSWGNRQGHNRLQLVHDARYRR